jgi:hypothetical protein
MMREALKTHDIVVFLDSDAIFNNPEVPIEWLMNYWSVSDNTTIALSSEPALERDADDRGNPSENTGFMIIQNHPLTFELYEAWAECPEDTRYENCSHWKHPRQREQAAFSNYIRYDPAFEPTIQILPCLEANGYPERFDETRCKGTFVRHLWGNKEWVKDTMARGVMQAFAPRLHGHFMEDSEALVEDLRAKKLRGSEIVDAR